MSLDANRVIVKALIFVKGQGLLPYIVLLTLVYNHYQL